MAHNFITLTQQSFITRVILGGCLININGTTIDCTIVVDKANKLNPSFTARNAESGQELCTFRPYDISGGPSMYQLALTSIAGGTATLIVPDHGLGPNEEYDEGSETSDDDEAADDDDENDG